MSLIKLLRAVIFILPSLYMKNIQTVKYCFKKEIIENGKKLSGD